VNCRGKFRGCASALSEKPRALRPSKVLLRQDPSVGFRLAANRRFADRSRGVCSFGNASHERASSPLRGEPGRTEHSRANAVWVAGPDRIFLSRPQTWDLRPQTSDLGPRTSDHRPQTSEFRPRAEPHQHHLSRYWVLGTRYSFAFSLLYYAHFSAKHLIARMRPRKIPSRLGFPKQILSCTSASGASICSALQKILFGK